MAKSLLNAVNEILKRVGTISGASGELSNLSDSARQRHIDVAVQAVNEVIDELYSASSTPAPDEQAESTITLVTGTRSYSLATDMVSLRWPFIDKTNTQFFTPYPGGYNRMIVDDPEQDDTGLALLAAISPVDGNLHLDRAPTSTENGNVYTYQYDKDTSLTLSSDTVPFTDAVFRAMVPAWVQVWKRELRNEFDEDLFDASVGRASRLLSQSLQRTTWQPR